jgi:hypothetical protein
VSNQRETVKEDGTDQRDRPTSRFLWFNAVSGVVHEVDGIDPVGGGYAPPPAEVRHEALLKRVIELERLAMTPTIGHNRPPEEIDATSFVPSRDDIARIVAAVRALDAAPKTVPSEAVVARRTLEEMIAKFQDAFVAEAGSMSAKVAVPVVAASAVLIILALIETVNALILWMDAVARNPM